MARFGGVRWLWLTLAVVVADRAIKYAIERNTSEGFRFELIPHFADSGAQRQHRHRLRTTVRVGIASGFRFF